MRRGTKMDALVKCPSCGRDSTNGRKTCWKCGYNFIENGLEGLIQEPVKQEPVSMNNLAYSLRFDGIYQSEPERDENGNEYCTFLRFYPDGIVIYVNATASAQSISKWFNRDNKELVDGIFRLNNNRLVFTTLVVDAIFSIFNGNVDNNKLILDSYILDAGTLHDQLDDNKTYNFIKLAF